MSRSRARTRGVLTRLFRVLLTLLFGVLKDVALLWLEKVYSNLWLLLDGRVVVLVLFKDVE